MKLKLAALAATLVAVASPAEASLKQRKQAGKHSGISLHKNPSVQWNHSAAWYRRHPVYPAPVSHVPVASLPSVNYVTKSQFLPRVSSSEPQAIDSPRVEFGSPPGVESPEGLPPLSQGPESDEDAGSPHGLYFFKPPVKPKPSPKPPLVKPTLPPKPIHPPKPTHPSPPSTSPDVCGPRIVDDIETITPLFAYVNFGEVAVLSLQAPNNCPAGSEPNCVFPAECQPPGWQDDVQEHPVQPGEVLTFRTQYIPSSNVPLSQGLNGFVGFRPADDEFAFLGVYPTANILKSEVQDNGVPFFNGIVNSISGFLADSIAFSWVLVGIPANEIGLRTDKCGQTGLCSVVSFCAPSDFDHITGCFGVLPYAAANGSYQIADWLKRNAGRNVLYSSPSLTPARRLGIEEDLQTAAQKQFEALHLGNKFIEETLQQEIQDTQ